MPFTSKQHMEMLLLPTRLRDICLAVDENIREILGLEERDVHEPQPDDFLNYINPKGGRGATFMEHYTPMQGIHFNLPLTHLHFSTCEEIILLEKRSAPGRHPEIANFGLVKQQLTEQQKMELKEIIKSGFEQPVLS